MAQITAYSKAKRWIRYSIGYILGVFNIFLIFYLFGLIGRISSITIPRVFNLPLGGYLYYSLSFMPAMIFNAFLMGLSQKKSFAKALVLVSQTLPLLFLIDLAIGMRLDDEDILFYTQTFGDDTGVFIFYLILFACIIAGAYFGMTNPLGQWIEKVKLSIKNRKE